jgi:hypothetical protein
MEPPDSPFVLSHWYRVAGETQALLRRNEELMEKRAELCRRRAHLFREILATAITFVHDASTSDRQVASISTGTVESSLRKR